MATIIAFSKDRPLQLHAYLESLLYYSDVKEEQINIIYLESEEISYNKVVENFPKVNFIKEKCFIDDVYHCLDKAEDFVLFGVDDAVFIRPFFVSKAEQCLRHNNEIYGYSFRLGKDITPCPDSFNKNGSDFYVWNWKETTLQHYYNYPWEMVATLYRKKDVLDMLVKEDRNKLKTPNFLELIPYSPDFFSVRNLDSRKRTFDFIKAPLMASNHYSSTVIITINRVQDDCPNAYDESFLSDIIFLNKLYNKNGDTLNIRAISKRKHNSPHVNSDFFILRKSKYLNLRIFIRNIIIRICFKVSRILRQNK
jgi:hypothetical protein